MATKEKQPNENPKEPVYPTPDQIDPTHRTQAAEIRFPNDILFRILGWTIIARPDTGQATWGKGKRFTAKGIITHEKEALESMIYELSLSDFGWSKINDHQWKNGKHTKVTLEAVRHLKKYLETSFLYPNGRSP